MATAKLGTIEARPSNIILGGDDVGGGSEFDKTIEDVLSLSDDVHCSQVTVSVDDPISLTDTVNLGYDLQLSASNAISLTDIVHLAAFDIHVTDTISLTQDAEANFEHIDTSNVLSLSDEVTVAGTSSPIASSNLGLTDNVVVTTPIKGETITDTMSLTDQVNIHYELSLADTISLVDRTQRIIAVYDTLSITQSASLARFLSVEDELSLTDEADRNVILNLEVDDSLGVTHSLTYFVDRDATECQYTPFVGDGPNDPAPPSTTPPTLGVATLTLTYPYASPTTTLVLRNPDFGNQRSLGFSRINRTTRGGSLEVFADPDWPQTETLSLTIDALSEAQAQAFLDFLGTSLGQEIGLLDWENRQWRGIITTPDADVTDNGTCRKLISFEFEGELA